MAEPRIVEGRLREEYFGLLPAMQRTLIAIETEVRYTLLPATLALDRSERIVVKSRLKDCESAVDALRRRQLFGGFDEDDPDQYSITSLPDLVGVRVLTFPHRYQEVVRQALWPRISEWEADHVRGIQPQEEASRRGRNGDLNHRPQGGRSPRRHRDLRGQSYENFPCSLNY